MSTYSPPITRARHASRPGPSRVRPDLATSGFAELGVPEPVVEALAAMGVTAPFPIQSATLPDGLAGRDVLGRAETGSGKTIAFAVPVVAALAERGYRRDPGRPGGLILVPTRELASQVAATVGPLARALGLRCATVYGGVSPRTQIASLGRADIVVATPGRLEDHTAQGHCRLNGVRVTVIDEADHMADLGFLPAVRRLLEQTPTDGQRLLFSATLDGAVDVLANRYLRQPATHAVDRPGGSPVNLEHHLFTVLPADKAAVVAELASGEGRSVLFTRTKHGARKLARQLAGAGIAAVDLHSNLAQKARERNLAAFASGRARVLVATDIAARGIHVDEVSLVVHVDPPAEHKAYLHRSGRTARAGAGGTVVTVATVDQARDVTQLLRKAKVLVESAKVTPGDARTAALLARPGGVPACGTASAVGAGTDRPVGSGSAPAACAGRDRPPASSRPGHRSRVGKGAEMTVGTVKWFNGTKGYGFIAPDGGGNDVFVHHSAIEGNGYKELSEGQRVEFESGDGPKGPQATSVRPA